MRQVEYEAPAIPESEATDDTLTWGRWRYRIRLGLVTLGLGVVVWAVMIVSGRFGFDGVGDPTFVLIVLVVVALGTEGAARRAEDAARGVGMVLTGRLFPRVERRSIAVSDLNALTPQRIQNALRPVGGEGRFAAYVRHGDVEVWKGSFRPQWVVRRRVVVVLRRTPTDARLDLEIGRWTLWPNDNESFVYAERFLRFLGLKPQVVPSTTASG